MLKLNENVYYFSVLYKFNIIEFIIRLLNISNLMYYREDAIY